MEYNVRRQISMLQIYAGILTLAVFALALLYILGRNHFNEIDARRINILEEDGTLRMVISNEKQQHPGRMDGKELASRLRSAGMIFFNNEGDECGGLVFDGKKKGAGMVYSVDQYKNDQVMQMQYAQDNDAGRNLRSYGLKIWDRSDLMTLGDLIRIDDSLKKTKDSAAYQKTFSDLQSKGLLGRERLFLGKTKAKEVGLFIRDERGRPRIEIGLDSSNHVVFQILDTAGKAFSLSR